MRDRPSFYTLVYVITLIGCLLGYTDTSQGQSDRTSFHFDTILPLPAPIPSSKPLGLAGAYIGALGNNIIVAGGANFPDTLPWYGGKKKYHQDIFILSKDQKGYSWEVSDISLPSPLGYGITIPARDSLLLIGGENSEGAVTSVYSIQLDDKNQLEIRSLPDLPVPLSNHCGGIINNEIFLAGSHTRGTKYFLKSNLDEIDWTPLPTWPGPPRTHAYGIVQNNGVRQCFYLMKGRQSIDGISTYHEDGYVFDPTVGIWEEMDIFHQSKSTKTLAAGVAVPVGANDIIFIGGSTGRLHNKIEELSKVATQDNHVKRELEDTLNSHPGFSREILLFNTITQSMHTVDSLENEAQVTTTAVTLDDAIYIISGETRPGVRTPTVNKITVDKHQSFGGYNYLILGVYLLGMLVIGFIFSKRQVNEQDFFRAGQRIPWWAAGISIYGTQLSAITYMAIPAKTFATDWTYFFLMMTIIMIMPIITIFYLPYFRKFNLTSAYEYLEIRFSRSVRRLGATVYLALQLGRMGIVLLLPALALSMASGFDVHLSIMLMGILSIVYTAMGGIEAVIWTDVLQVIILVVGALLSLLLLYWQVEPEVLKSQIDAFKKMKIFDFRWRWDEPTIWVVTLGGIATNLIQYGSDQTVIQRYLTTATERQAAHSIKLGAWLTLPTTILFFSLGTLLFSYYRTHPESLAILQNTDALFPWYIVSDLPVGVGGLLIAAIFAASMSSLDSSMNAISAVITTDFQSRFKKSNRVKNGILHARIITIITGMIGTCLALTMATWGISSLWDQFNLIIGLFAGGLGGVFVLGIFFPNSNARGAMIGLVASGLVQYLFTKFTDLHLLMFAFTGMTSCIIIGVIFSAIFRSPTDRYIDTL